MLVILKKRCENPSEDVEMMMKTEQSREKRELKQTSGWIIFFVRL